MFWVINISGHCTLKLENLLLDDGKNWNINFVRIHYDMKKLNEHASWLYLKVTEFARSSNIAVLR